MGKTKRVNLWLVLMMTLIAALSCFFGVFTLKGDKSTVSASAATETDVTDTVSIVNSSYGENQSQFIIKLTPANTLTTNAWWNINGSSLITANNGVDIMNYIYINGQNLRTLSDDNRTSNTYPVDTASGWLTNSDQCRPAFVESTGDGIYVTVLHAFSTTNYTITLKAGFSILNTSGTMSTVNQDVSFGYNAGSVAKQTDVTETVSIVNSSYGEKQSQFIIKLNPASTLTSNAWWNINGSSLITANNGVDIMNYIYINGQNIRTLSDNNRTSNTYPVGSATGWLTNSDQCRPAFVESTGDGIYVTVLHAFSTTNYKITLKAGFSILNTSGTMSTVNEDVNFTYNAGTVSKEAKKTDVKDTVNITNSSYGENQSQFIIKLNPASTLTSNAWWNINGSSLITANNGVDIMNYIYINGQNLRTLSDNNRTSNTYPVDTASGWLANSDQCRPAFVESVADGIYVTVLHAFSTTNYTITLKAGFDLVNADGGIYTISEDVSFAYSAGTVSKVHDYTLSFEGLSDTKTVTTGQPIGELPAVPEKSGYTGVWAIDGVTITADTVYNYGANKTAAAVYTKVVERVDVTETVTIENGSCNDVQSQFAIKLIPASTLTSNAWWNINGSTLIAANNGVDIMNYIYINGENLRTLSDDNRTNNSYPVGSATGWLTNSDQCRPAFVESAGAGIFVTVLHAFSTTNYTITLKAGFEMLNASGDISVISEDVSFIYNAGTITKIQEYTLSFDGLEDTLTVVDNEKIGELPEIPVKEGCEGVWAINGTEITANTVWTYGGDKTAVAVYKKDITKTFGLDNQPSYAGAATEVVFVAQIDPTLEGGGYLKSHSTVSGVWNFSYANYQSANNGVDILEYICINGEDVRSAVNKNNAGTTNYKGDAGWLSNGGACAPVFVEATAENGLVIRIYTGYSKNFFEITFKAGFRLIDTDGTVVYLSENVTYKYINDNGTVTFTKGTITAEDLDRLNGQNITLMNGAEVYAEKKTGGWTLPAIDPISDGNNDNETLDQVFVGWTTAATFEAGMSDLYPAGHLFVPTGTTTLYAVWIEFELEDGAGVRLTSDSSGYRFKARINSTHYNTTYNAIISDIGMIVTPTNYLEYVDFTHVALGSGNYAEVSKATLGEEWQWMQGGEGSADAMWIYAAAFTGIPENMYSRMNSARGYLKINYTSGAGYIYTPYNEENNARSIYTVATLAYDDYNGHATLKNYVNKVADITWDGETFKQTESTKGDWTISSISANGATITVAVEGDFASVLINGKRLIEGYSTNVTLGNYIYKFSELTFTGTGFTFMLGAADGTVGKVNDETLYFYSSDSDLDFFLNDFFKRHSGYTEDGVNLKVNSVTAGVNSEEFFSHEWMSKAYYWYNSDDGYAEDRIAGLRTFLSSVPVDDYGYVWSSNDNVRPNNATPSSAEQRMGWPYPSNDDIKGVSWDFNGTVNSWTSNIGATSSNNLFTANVSGQTEDILFSSPNGFYGSGNIFTRQRIYTYSAPLLEFDIRIDDVTNVNDILVGYTTSAQSTTQWVSVKENAFMSYDIGNATGAYNHLIFMPMYAFWGTSNSTYLKQIQIKVDIKDGKAMSGNVGLNYVRPTIDTRMTNNNSILISSLRQDYDFTGDLTYLQNNITRARKAINFLMQMYDSSRKLNKQSYLVGHDGDQGDIESSLGNGYWDILFMPEYDFQSNIYFYKAVADMAYLEGILTANSITVDTSLATIKTATRSGATSTSVYSYTADSLTTVANNVLGTMQATTANGGFWNESTGRFAAGYNSSGTLYDYGYVAWNLEAIYYGIATETQATSIMTWLNSETELYDYKFAPISITETGDKKVLNGQYYNNSSIKSNWVNCQYGGAILYTSFYDLMARIDYSGTDDAYARLQEIQAWYMEVYNNYMQEIGANPNEFYRYYYEEKGIVVQGQGINGAVGLDAEFLESYLPLSAVAYGFFGIDSIDGKTLKIAPELPTELNYWGMENLAFNFVEYDLKAYKNGVQITSVRGDTTGLRMRIVLNYVAGQKVYVNGVETSNYTVENGKVCVTVDFGATIVEVK